MSIVLQPIRTPDQQVAVKHAARADGHALLAPTHAVLRDRQVIGYVSILAMPVVHVWMDSNAAGVRDSLSMLAQAEAIVRDRGAKHYYLPCQQESPFFPLLEKAGFVDLGGNAHLFHRQLEE
jgi:hypothetical protein